jgi:hypothetical protein
MHTQLAVRWLARRGLFSLLLAAIVVSGLPVLPRPFGIVRSASAASGSPATFAYTGSSQSWTVPAGITSIRVDAQGAQGDGAYGGLGGRAVATLAVTPGQVLQVMVGGAGAGATAGFNGGGSGGPFSGGAGAGGGASDVRTGAFALADRAVVAGGGGGAGPGGATPTRGPGGSGGGTTGEDGSKGLNNVDGWAPGLGATQTAGGAGGVEASGGTYGNPGTLGAGGGGRYAGGAGGGGYYGGGEGASGNFIGGGGGGGASYAAPGATAVSFTRGTTRGNGTVTIAYPAGPTPAPGGGPPVATFSYTAQPQF